MPLLGQVVLDLVAPPIGASLWWLYSRGFAGLAYRGDVSETIKKRQNKLFFVVLALLYLVMFGVTLYGHLTGWRPNAR